MEKITYKLKLFLIALLGFPFVVNAQILEIEEMWKNQLDTSKVLLGKPEYLQISNKEIIAMFDRQPYFGMYKDNYIIAGMPVNEKLNKRTTDVKFQVSVRQRLIKKILPFYSALMLTYTQKSFWNVAAESAPFKDNNYNPGLALIAPVISNNQLQGAVTFSIEHESNGRDSIWSRSWNFVSLSGVYWFNASFSAQAKIWTGFSISQPDKETGVGGNADLLKYRGYGLVAVNFRSLNDKFRASAVVNPRGEFGKFNTQLEFCVRPRPFLNHYLFIQWYRGYGESLLDYNQFSSVLRIGICIKPPLRNLY